MIVFPSDIIHGKFQTPTPIRHRDMPCRLDQTVTWHHINHYISWRVHFYTMFVMWIWISVQFLFQQCMIWPPLAKFFSICPMTSLADYVTSGRRKIKSRLRWNSRYRVNTCAKFQGLTMSRSKVFGKHTDIQTYIHTDIQTYRHNNVYYNKICMLCIL